MLGRVATLRSLEGLEPWGVLVRMGILSSVGKGGNTEVFERGGGT